MFTFKHTFECNHLSFAYFAPYSNERHLDLLQTAQTSELCRLSVIGQSVQKRDMSLLTIGDVTENKKKVWIIARQHPGESMAEWFMEGFIERILDQDDALSRGLLKDCVFYLVPNMNPDGSVLGNLRSNAAGINLNREWLKPSLEQSPEVFCVLDKIRQTGVDLFLDVHGDEALPYNFVAACEGIPSYNDKTASLEATFKRDFAKASPDFQVEKGYPVSNPGEANLSMASTQIGEAFACLSLTLEMPFKDNEDLPDSLYGWSPERSKNLARAIFHPIKTTIDSLKLD